MKVRVTLDEWMKLQEKNIRLCDRAYGDIPKTIFIGVKGDDGFVEVRMKLVALSEWEKFQDAWERISGVNYPNYNGVIPRLAPQFFLICN